MAQKVSHHPSHFPTTCSRMYCGLQQTTRQNFLMTGLFNHSTLRVDMQQAGNFATFVVFPSE
jgi:hypothetical protein